MITASGSGLRRWRIARGMKQSHLAELMGVHQATISRWEQGGMAPSARQVARLTSLLRAGPLAAGHDAALRRLVEGSVQRLHLICDRTHRLLAASGPRWSQWRRERAELEGACMLRFASPEILAAEQGLASLGWFDGEVGELEVQTGANLSLEAPIMPGRFLWQQVLLADGGVARLTVHIQAA